MTAHLQAVLFDMDGTLCDTEPVWMAAELAMAQRYGAGWTPADGLALVGKQLIVSCTYIKERMGLPQPVEAVFEELLAGAMTAIAHEGPAWRPGALDLLMACNGAGLPTALVTASHSVFTEAILDGMPSGRFDAVVTGDHVERGKPAPDPYLLAADLLEVNACSCIAIEDSPTGAESAEAAGCLVIVVPNQVAVSSQGRRREVDSLAELSLADLQLLFEQDLSV
ncbi:MAG: HAD family phosphatase [Nocardioidaceae bacterium]|nr:HAD family phosphatase [Nocardioidaceae bacterium]